MPTPVHNLATLMFFANRVYRGWRGLVKRGKTTWDAAIAKGAPDLYPDEVPIVRRMIDEAIARDVEEKERKSRGKVPRPEVFDPTPSRHAPRAIQDGGKRRVIKKGTEFS